MSVTYDSDGNVVYRDWTPTDRQMDSDEIEADVGAAQQQQDPIIVLRDNLAKTVVQVMELTKIVQELTSNQQDFATLSIKCQNMYSRIEMLEKIVKPNRKDVIGYDDTTESSGTRPPGIFER